MIQFFKSPLLRKAAFAAALLIAAGTAATPALADGYYRPAAWHHAYGGWHGGWYVRYWGPRFYGPAYVYPPAVYAAPAPGVGVWIR